MYDIPVCSKAAGSNQNPGFVQSDTDETCVTTYGPSSHATADRSEAPNKLENTDKGNRMFFLCKYINISFEAIPLPNGVYVLIMDEGFRRHINYFKKYNEADGNNIVETQNIFNLTCLFS